MTGSTRSTNLRSLEGGSLYAVGGVWRSFARVDMEEIGYPLHVLHDYQIPRARALKLCKVVAQLSRKSLDKMKIVSRRRAESLPYGAVVLERLLLATGSARGRDLGLWSARRSAVREIVGGRTRARSADRIRRRHQCAASAARRRMPKRCFEWSSPLFRQRTPDEEPRAPGGVVCSPISAGAAIPTTARLGAFNQVLTAPFAGAGHRARAIIAAAIFYRYSGDEDFPREHGAARAAERRRRHRLRGVSALRPGWPSRCRPRP